MIRNHSRSIQRSAFTLVELMVVILIIAILVSLLSAGVMKAMNKIPEVQTRTEITELDTALRAFMTDYGLTEPPPSVLWLNEANPAVSLQDNNRSGQFLQKVFGKNLNSVVDWNGDNIPNGPWLLQGHQALIFYLGGIPNSLQMATIPGTPPGPQGFSSNNMNPAINVTVSPKRKGPYFTFITSRLWPQVPFPGWNGFFVYLDPWMTKTGPFYTAFKGTPYAYFSSYGNNNGYSLLDCSQLSYPDALGTHVAMPYSTGTSGTMLTYTNPTTYQIISAGKDGMFGYNPAFLTPPINVWSPTSGVTLGPGQDDQANFSSTLLGSGQN